MELDSFYFKLIFLYELTLQKFTLTLRIKTQIIKRNNLESEDKMSTNNIEYVNCEWKKVFCCNL